MSPAARAWNQPGHMVVATIAFNTLRGHDDDAIKNTVALLQHHPFFDPSWSKQIAQLSQEDRALVLFMLAAAWPDEVRRDARYHHGPWHYINFPYVPAGQPRTIVGRAPETENILTAFDRNARIAQDPSQPAADRAIALAWMFHLAGDVHQPLHTVSLYSTQWPNGDRGGTDFFIRAKAENQPISLHTFWDGLIIGSERLQSIRNASITIAKTYPRGDLREMNRRTFREWAEESFVLAQTHAYLSGRLPGSAGKTDVPALTQSYRTSAKALAERRAALAGYRLAALLKALFD
ncbi:MAG: S1/P1 nuclease [Candidatus Hydrogenedentes bacterium]|nr:S1/P1 nuclease [Candidatus Hydrogenedentota bacterium]